MNEIFNFFGGKTKLARLLGIDSAAVSGWIKRGRISDNAAIKIERLSYGKFKAVDIVNLKS